MGFFSHFSSWAIPIGNLFFQAGFFSIPGVRTATFALYDAYKREESFPLFPPDVDLSEYDLVIDVGAGLGFFTRFMYFHTRSDTEILSFEPEPRNFALLKARVDAIGSPDRVSLHELAVSDISGEAELFLNMKHFGDHTIQRGEFRGHMRRCKGIKVQATTLSDVLASVSRSARRVLLKIDVQGHEPSVLAGFQAESLKGCFLDILTEFSPVHLHAQGIDPREFLRTLCACSSSVRVKKGDGTFCEISSIDVEIPRYTELWCKNYRPLT